MMMLLMLNLNQAIKINRQLVILLLLCFVIKHNALALTEVTLPEEFQSLSINSKALSKKFEFTVDETTIATAQNFALDKTSVILHLQPIPKLKNEDTRIKLINNDFENITLYPFKGDTFFAVADPDKSYTIIEENIINCNELINTFGTDSKNTICPESISFILANNISITEDKSFRLNTNHETQLFLLMAILDNATPNISDDFKILSINDSSNLPELINLSSALNIGNLCIKSTRHSKKNIESNCTFDNKKVQAIIKFKNNFKDLDLSNNENTINITFPFPKRLFNNLDHKLILEIKEDFSAKTLAKEINGDSLDQFLFEGYNITLNSYLNNIPKSTTKINKNTFNLNESVNLNQTRKKITLNFLKDDIEAIIKPFIDQNESSTLTSLNISGKNNNLTNILNISLPNNIKLKNSEEPDDQLLNRFQTTARSNLEITTYLPSDVYNINIERIYSAIEQNIAPSVNDEGESIEIVNDKAKVDLTFNKIFSSLELPDTSTGITSLTLKKASKLIEKENDFNNQLTISGFLIPPDFRPLVEPDYRATISLSRTFPVSEDESFSINYSELKTKEEVTFTNFFKFLFLPSGLYNAILEFNGNREELFNF